MTIQNLGSKTEVLSLLANDVVAASGTGSAVELVDYCLLYTLDAADEGGNANPGGRLFH